MKRIDLHSHVIPETIIKAMREQPTVYNTQIEGEGDTLVFKRGKVAFDLIPEQPVERLDAVPRLTEKERGDVCYRSAMQLFGEGSL